jgi:hypothetical protein
MDYNKKEYNRETEKNFEDFNLEKPKIPLSYYFPKEGNTYHQKENEQNYSGQKNFTEMHMTPSNIRNFNQNKYRFGDVNLSSINNMNINIINQAPTIQNEDLINRFANINLNRENLYFQTAPKKDMYFNYYFGGGKNDDNSVMNHHPSMNNNLSQMNYGPPSYQNYYEDNYNNLNYYNPDSTKTPYFYPGSNMSQFSNKSTPQKKDPYTKSYTNRHYANDQSQSIFFYLSFCFS